MQTLKLRILSPLEDLFTGEAVSVSSKNSLGNFDILPDHANFVTLINNEPIIARLTDGSKKTFRYPMAVLHVSKNNVNVYTDIAQAESLLPGPLPLK